MTKWHWLIVLSGIIVFTSCIATIGIAVRAQEKAPENKPASDYLQNVKFALSEVENLKLENLRLERMLTQCQLNTTNANYQQELNKYVQDTLKSHGLPPNVSFDGQNLRWVVAEDKKPDDKAKDGIK